MLGKARVLDAAFFILLASAMATMAYGFPGHVPFDAIVQLYEGTTGRFVSFSPPVLSTVWAVLYGWGDGVWPIITIQILLLLGGLWLIVRGASWAGGFVIPALILATWWPPVVNWQSVVVKDVSFADLSLFGFLILHYLATRPSGALSAGRMTACAAIALFAFTLAALSRPQGLACLAIGAVVTLIVIYRAIATNVPRRKRSAIAAGLVLGPVLVFQYLLSGLPYWVSNGQPPDTMRIGLEQIMLYDIAGILYRDPDLDLSRLEATGFDADQFRAAVKEAYTAERIDYLAMKPGMAPVRNFVPPGADPLRVLFSSVARAWLASVIHHFPAYLDHRLASFGWLLGLHEEDYRKCVPVYVGVSDEPKSMRAELGLAQYPDPRNGQFYMALMSLSDSLIYRHWAYALATILELLWLAVTYRRGDEAAIGLAATALIITASFLPIGLACDFRYLYLPLLASVCLPVLIATRRPRREAIGYFAKS